MKIEPVFLLAPQPTVPPTQTRRGFLLAGAMFGLGAVLGGSAVKWVFSNDSKALPPAADLDLAQLHRTVSPENPLDRLAENYQYVIGNICWKYRDDPLLWKGLVRLARGALEKPDLPNRQQIAKSLLLMDLLVAHRSEELKALAPELAAVAR